MHPTSLPGAYGIGDMGPEAYAFADYLAESDVCLWQILPLGPTGFGNSPYAARSTFAGNELLISLDKLREDGLLEDSDLSSPPPFPCCGVDYSMVDAWKMPLLKKAARNFLATCGQHASDYDAFCMENAFWLDDYAMFMVLYERYQDARWFSVWDREIGDREPRALQDIMNRYGDQIEIRKVLQYFFERQWQELRSYVNGHGIKFIGDIPIFVAPDSVDTWSHIELFKTDEEGHYSAVSGVPPDCFSSTGQLWGNPVYDWDAIKADGYAWWIQRIKRLLSQTDILRIDHFRGFDAYWEVPYGDKTAEHGTWVKAPGKEFFTIVRKELGQLPILAEDLGFMTQSVEELRDSNGFPGMKVCQFGFSRDTASWPNPFDMFLPHNYEYNSVAYTGTHDNDTTRGWYTKLSEDDRDMVRRYLACNDHELVWAMIRAVMASHAKYAIFPMQDILDIGSEARMNVPSTCGPHNWSWRMERKDYSQQIAHRMSELVRIYARNGKSWQETEQEHLAQQAAWRMERQKERKEEAECEQ
jgi:4-alpha-glucanotransferase